MRRYDLKLLYRKVSIRRRQTLWLMQDCTDTKLKRQLLNIYRNLCVLKRQLRWILFPPFERKVVSEILRKIYAPAIAHMFKAQLTVWDRFAGRL